MTPRESLSVTFRSMRAGDASRLAAIDALSNRPCWTENQFLQELSLPQSVAVAAESGELIIGFGVFWAVAGTAQLLQIGVAPEWRGRGAGEALLRHLMRTARSKDCSTMELEFREGNATARRLYEKCGFRTVGRRGGFYGDSDGILMECVL